MCGDDAFTTPDAAFDADSEPIEYDVELSRRSLLAGAAGAAGVAVAGLLPAQWLTPRTAEAAAAAGVQPLSMAMHIHSSFSEQTASMESHLFQAAKNAVDVIWWTDHDFRMQGIAYKNVVHFTSLTNEQTDGAPWQWERQNTGSLTAASGGSIVSSPASPNDPVAGSSLQVSAQSAGTGTSAVRFFAQDHPAGFNYRRSTYGLTLNLDVFPASVANGGYLELLIGSSYHQAKGGRPAGIYSLSYRFDGTATGVTRTAQGLQGIIRMPAPTGRWTTVTITPTNDIAALWPDLESHDFGCQKIQLGAVSTGGLTKGNFDYLRFTRNFASGDLQLQAQMEMEPRYAAAYPSVAQRHGLEISQFLPHLNWFGGAVHIGDYTGVRSTNWQAFCLEQVTAAHNNGGLVSYNHPFGFSAGAALPTAQQDSLLSALSPKLLANKALNCDIIEVGYVVRSGVDTKHHIGLWDVMSRNGLFLTGNGVSDDHAGTNWTGQKNNWVTSVWGASKAESDLLAGLRAGRAWSYNLAKFRGTLDLMADGSAPMGSVTVSTANTRNVLLSATAMPSGSSLQVVRGVVDYGGASHPTPNATVVKTYAASALASGSVTYAADNTSSAFYRTQVVASNGAIIAASNPVWLLRSAPPGGVPAPRAA
jgi:hypothetical protein